MPITAIADPLPVPPRCDGGYCIPIDSLRVCDRDHAVAVECPLQLRAAETRATVAAGDALRLSAAVDLQAATVIDLRQALASERARLPAWSWYLTGAATGLVLTVAAIVIGALSL